MKKGICRPWDKRRRTTTTTTATTTTTTTAAVTATSCSEFPLLRKQADDCRCNSADGSEDVTFVEVDGIKYYSDRFYLNSSIYDNNDNDNDNRNNIDVHQKTSDTTTTSTGSRSTTGSRSFSDHDRKSANSKKNSSCCCGVHDPPPLFCRSKLVASLNLKAAILATYSLDLEICVQQFPNLFDTINTTTIPTLVLHGKRGWGEKKVPLSDEKKSIDKQQPLYNIPMHNNTETTNTNTNTIPSTLSPNISSQQQEQEDDIDSLAEDWSIGTQNDDTIFASTTFGNHLHTFHSPEPVSDDKALSSQDSFSHPNSTTTVGSSVLHFAEITSSWYHPETMPATYSKAIDPITCALRTEIIQTRLYKRGVHHPKFMILFEKDGSVVIVVTTANLSNATANDATWVQRFPPATSNGIGTNSESDFGPVLTNFLQCQMMATAPDQMTAHAFVQRYLHWKSLSDLERLFDYSTAQVYLIPTIPGEYNGRHSSKQQSLNQIHSTSDAAPTTTTPSHRSFLYGPQRVAYILNKLSVFSSTTNTTVLQTEQDRLIIQPTSIGGDWDVTSMSDIVRSYLGHDDRSKSDICDSDLLQRIDIVWPTDYFVRSNANHLNVKHGTESPKLESKTNRLLGFASNTDSIRDIQQLETEKENGGFLYFSSETFNKTHWDCLSRMVMYESSVPAQRPNVLIPHFKSIARLYTGDDSRLRRNYNIPKCEEYFPWYLLTSACLSRGAQGHVVLLSGQCRVPESDTMSYSNFELGVLFTSQLQHNLTTNRLYCWKPYQCCCRREKYTTTKRCRVIHLPSPYQLRPAPYVIDEEHMELVETPYFHEVVRDNACVGNMLSTPYGSALAEQYATALAGS